MINDFDIQLLLDVIKNLAIPGNTGYELIALAVVIALIVWRRKK